MSGGGHGHGNGDEHGHGHEGGCGCGHGHQEDGDGGEQWSLYQQVDTVRACVLNATVPDSIKYVLRPWADRMDRSLPIMESDADEQLLLCVPFTGIGDPRSLDSLRAHWRGEPV